MIVVPDAAPAWLHERLARRSPERRSAIATAAAERTAALDLPHLPSAQGRCWCAAHDRGGER